MTFHPMEFNVNTGIRWEAMKELPILNSLQGKNVLDLGSGLGFFSVRLAERGATVLAVDIDTAALRFLHEHYGIRVQTLDVVCDPLPTGPFDLIIMGEILEHIDSPEPLIAAAAARLTTGGTLLLTTPALEGWLTDSWGKRLGHHHGSEAHARDGYTLDELRTLLRVAGLEPTLHRYSVFLGAELFMQITKMMFLLSKKEYHGQADVLKTLDSPKFRLLRFAFPFLFHLFRLEQRIGRRTKAIGHCHIICGQKSNHLSAAAR
jgi:SAM-dependent methyltransferase